MTINFSGLQSQSIIVIEDLVEKGGVVERVEIAAMEGMTAEAKVHIDIADVKDDIAGTEKMIGALNLDDIVEAVVAHIRGLEVEHLIRRQTEIKPM